MWVLPTKLQDAKVLRVLSRSSKDAKGVGLCPRTISCGS